MKFFITTFLSLQLFSHFAHAKLVVSFDEEYSQKQLRVFIYEFNKTQFSIAKSHATLKKLYKTKADHAYLARIRKLVKFRLKPKMFYYPDHIEIRINGKIYGKVTEIDPFHESVNLNGQTISFKQNKPIEKLHKEILSAMEGHVAFSPLHFFIPEAQAMTSHWTGAIASLYMMMPTLQYISNQWSGSTFEGQFNQTSDEQLCDNPTSNSNTQYLLRRILTNNNGGRRQGNSKELYVFTETFNRHNPTGLGTAHTCTSYWQQQRPQWRTPEKTSTLTKICTMAQRAKRTCHSLNLKKQEVLKTTPAKKTNSLDAHF